MNDKKEALVSVVMPAYNCEEFIGKAIDSVINQSYKNWEVLVIDDCSTDKTASIAKDYTNKDDRIKYCKLEKNSGAAIARNMAIGIANGKYIAFLDSDDVWFSEKLTKQIYYMENNDYGFTCTSYTKIDEKGNFLNKIISAKKKCDYDEILKTCPGNSTVIYNVQKLGKVKILDIRKRNDYVMWLKIIKMEKYLYGLEEPLGSHRIRSSGISSNKISLIKYHWRVYREIEKLTVLKSSYLVTYWVTATMFKLR